MYEIPSTPADGNVKVSILTEMADAAPTIAELTAETTVDISCYLTPDGFAFTPDQATITDDRLCSTQTFNKPGRKSYTLALTGIDNTNSPEYETEYNEMADVLTEGARRFAVYRSGLPFDQEYEGGQKVRIIPFTVGMKQELPPEANTTIRATWNAFVDGTSELVEVPSA